jgi:hypothetical protein
LTSFIFFYLQAIISEAVGEAVVEDQPSGTSSSVQEEVEEKLLVGKFEANVIYKAVWKRKYYNVNVVRNDPKGYFVRKCKLNGELFDVKGWYVKETQIKEIK